MLASVVFPINAEAFTYIVPEELERKIGIGSRVKAPFKKNNKIGIVIKIDSTMSSTSCTDRENATRAFDEKNIHLRAIKNVLEEVPFVPENVINLIRWAGNYYMSSTGLALKNAIPSAFFTDRRAGTPRVTYDIVNNGPRVSHLTPEQKEALAIINQQSSGVFLLHGVTGSGKTEVYIRAIKALPADKKAIVLVPEIAITAQMIDRFHNHFKDEVAFFHSGLSIGERMNCWLKMRRGEVKAVIGVRSAVFAPFEKLGMIVIDEEQEASYKQFEGLRYNARDVALARAKLENAKAILGSATPSMEVYYNTRKGTFTCLNLDHRIDNKEMPRVEIIDMTREDKHSFSFSNRLLDALRKNISDGHQSLLLLNRRGYSPFYMCTDCGHSYKCPSCSVTLIYHKDTGTLNCHYCNAYMKMKAVCPQCMGTRVKYFGSGTQRAEEELCAVIPEVSLRRMDRDTTRKKFSHYRVIKQMEDKEIDVLLGTQMVAKGHDFPSVTLSAIVYADVALNLPDFRSAERAFQLFTQLAGRAGRGDVTGTAYIQTYEADHYVFHYIQNHDYHGFFENEIQLRRELAYPPYGKLIRIIIGTRNREKGMIIAKRMQRKIKTMKMNATDILGPAPAPIEKIRNLWRWHIMIKGKNAKSLRFIALRIIESVKKIHHEKDVKIEIDVDPVNMM